MKKRRALLAGILAVGFILTIGLLPGRVLAFPIIQEVFYDGPSGDAEDVFTEIFSAPGESLDGWSLVGVSGSNGSVYRTVYLTGAVIPEDGILVIATASATGDALESRDFVADVDWQNGPDAVQLFDPLGNIVDALQYGDAGVNNAGEGTPALDVEAGFSLSRDLFGTDTEDNFADFIALSSPTPGVGPTPDTGSSSVPEPGTLALVSTGVLGLVVCGRKRH